MRFLNFYRLIVRPILFCFDAEAAHRFVFAAVGFLWSFPLTKRLTRFLYARHLPSIPVNIAGVDFANPIGLAAGFDKNGSLLPGIENLGFGFLEIGTITPRPQIGNPPPRMFRVVEKRALLNRMGFNNDGADAVAARLKGVKQQLSVPLGVNLGKNRDTPNSKAIDDYEFLFKKFEGLADYFVVNISSPNTPGLRDLQNGAFVQKLGAKILELKVGTPVFVKLAPDIAGEDLQAICRQCGAEMPFAGLILTNTMPTDLGGLSGCPLKGPSTELLKLTRKYLSPEIPIISVGGIETVKDVQERLALGASAVQLYSGLVYEGPAIVGRLVRQLRENLPQT